MKTYSVGTRLFCDFHFSGKPKAVAIAILKPGTGKDTKGLIRVRITETAGAYRKGEVLEISSFTAVPLAQRLPLKAGQFFTRVSTLYAWS